MKKRRYRYFNRELSWLAFNHRVLQEAMDPTVPLFERLKFLAIFSNNLDEFYRVRVASLKSLLNLKKKVKHKLEIDPGKLLDRIKKVVHMQQEEFGRVFGTQVLPELNSHGVYLVNEKELNEAQRTFVQDYFRKHVEALISPVFLGKNKEAPFLQNKSLYLVAKLHVKRDTIRDGAHARAFMLAILEMPSQHTPRFVVLPYGEGTHGVILLDDIVRVCLPEIFPNHVAADAYAIKLTRDADLHIEDEFGGDLLDKIITGLKKRKTGVTSRFLYDSEMPRKVLNALMKSFSLKNEDVVPGARYHNFNDFINFPDLGVSGLSYPSLPPLSHSLVAGRNSLLDVIRNSDIALHYPYHQFDTVVRFLEEGSQDPHTTSIQITLYRVASDSRIVKSLINAALKGKTVTAFVEVKARFDEESNLQWAEEMEKAGVKVLYSLPGLKVHAKMCLVTRTESGKQRNYLYLSTGNFNEKTARVYTDLGLFTSHEQLAGEVSSLFKFLEGTIRKVHSKHMIIAPTHMRKTFCKLVDREIKHSRRGAQGSMILKMNSLEDREMIAKLYEASTAGVNIRLIVRGICCLVPGVKGMSENIKVVSIVDRFLEHARIYAFHNNGREQYFASSADLMTRNLSRRVEVMFPIYQDAIKGELKAMLELQFGDGVKARTIDKHQTNSYKKSKHKSRSVSSQVATYDLLRQASQKIITTQRETPGHNHRDEFSVPHTTLSTEQYI